MVFPTRASAGAFVSVGRLCTRPGRVTARSHPVMSRRDAERFADILDAMGAIRAHLGRGDLSDGLVYDAVRVRLIEIGEAAKTIPAEVVASKARKPSQASVRFAAIAAGPAAA